MHITRSEGGNGQRHLRRTEHSLEQLDVCPDELANQFGLIVRTGRHMNIQTQIRLIQVTSDKSPVGHPQRTCSCEKRNPAVLKNQVTCFLCTHHMVKTARLDVAGVRVVEQDVVSAG
jgi:hypothetical protein